MYERMVKRMDEIRDYSVDGEDLMRSVRFRLFQRTDPDGFKESARVFVTDQMRVFLSNRQGKWRLRRDAVKVEFERPETTVMQEPDWLAEHHPGQVFFRRLDDEDLPSAGRCHRIEVTLSAGLVESLARLIRAKRDEAASSERAKGWFDPLEWVVSRRILFIGTADPLKYGETDYDGYGDLLSQMVFTGYDLNSSIGNAVFEVPAGLPVFVAHNASDLASHDRKAGRQAAWLAWSNLAFKVSILSTNKLHAGTGQPAR